MSTDFDEDRLPPGQQLIATTSVQQFTLQAELLMGSKPNTGYSTMGVVTGLPGVGKTIAIRAFLDGLASRPHTGLPACVVIKVKPGSTPRQLMEDLFISVDEKPHSINTNRYKIADEAAEAILSNDLKALFVDDAEQLNKDGFEFLRYIFAKTGCSIVVIGLSQILRLINLLVVLGCVWTFFRLTKKKPFRSFFPNWSFLVGHLIPQWRQTSCLARSYGPVSSHRYETSGWSSKMRAN
jgi:hypothetical protein